MHAFLITGATNEERADYITRVLDDMNVHPVDRVTAISSAESGRIGIKDVRQFIRALSIAPSQSAKHAGIIGDMSLVTNEAQQALLKTLEEPPASVVLYLSTPTSFSCLPTIVSRCELTTLSRNRKESADIQKRVEEIEHLLSMPASERIYTIATFGKKQADFSLWLDQAFDALHRMIGTYMAAKPTARTRALLSVTDALMHAKRNGSTNVSVQTSIEHAFLSIGLDKV